MESIDTPRKSLKPLAIAIAIFHVVLALYTIFSISFNISTLLGGNVNINPIITRTFNFIWPISTILVLLWFILMKGHLKNGTRVAAIVGLSILIAINLIYCVIDICFPSDARYNIYSSILYTIISLFFNLVGMMMTGIAFIVMKNQFDRKSSIWSLVIGVTFLIRGVMPIASYAMGFIIPHIMPYTDHINFYLILNMVQESITLLAYISTVVFFFLFAHSNWNNKTNMAAIED